MDEKCFERMVPIPEGLKIKKEDLLPPPLAFKNDGGKPLAGQMLRDFAHALQLIAKNTTWGINGEGYAPGSWREVPNASERYQDALVRHLLAHFSGELIDERSKQLHLVMAGWNILALIELESRNV